MFYKYLFLNISNYELNLNRSFGQAVFFAGTVLTTIGYGDVSPLTPLGKIFCIIFALIGIPTTLLLLYAIIERLMKLTSFLLSKFCDLYEAVLNRLKIRFIQRSHMHVIFALKFAFLVLVFLFLIPAAIYAHIENWTYLNAFYYCFISLSTVGLGDYVPGDHQAQKHRHLYKILSTVYLIIGVMIMVWLLEIFSETPEFNFYKYFTLTKDGILTSHRDTVHTASSISGSTEYSSSAYKNMDNAEPSVTYQQQLNNSPSQTKINGSNVDNDDELILNNSSNKNQNYFSLNSMNTSIP